MLLYTWKPSQTRFWVAHVFSHTFHRAHVCNTTSFTPQASQILLFYNCWFQVRDAVINVGTIKTIINCVKWQSLQQLILVNNTTTLTTILPNSIICTTKFSTNSLNRCNSCTIYCSIDRINCQHTKLVCSVWHPHTSTTNLRKRDFLCLPINLRVQVLQKGHTQNVWAINIQNSKFHQTSYLTKINYQANKLVSNNCTLISQSHSNTWASMTDHPKQFDQLRRHEIVACTRVYQKVNLLFTNSTLHSQKLGSSIKGCTYKLLLQKFFDSLWVIPT